MGNKSSAPAPPDYSGIIAASTTAANHANDLQNEQFQWAKQAYAHDQGVNDQVVKSQLEAQNFNQANAEKDRATYENTFQPEEQALVNDANSYASPERKALEMGRAQADVGQQFDAQRQQAQTQLESYGINPSATRFQALDIGMRSAEAAAKAAAGTNASLNTDATARQLRAQAIDVGRGYPGQVANSSGAGVGAGSAAAGTELSTTGSGASTMGTSAQYGAQQNAALGTWGSTINTGYQNQLAAFNANQQASSGIGSALGFAGGIIGKAALGLAEGGAVPGGTPSAVPVSASPSRGAIPDDVNARLTPGEFVLPADVMQWKGQEWAQKEIMKARQGKQEAVAKPAVKPALPGAPAYMSGGAVQSALPC